MAMSRTRECAIQKCDTSSCATCHCCKKDLCINHLKEHKEQLNTQLNPLAHQINTFLDEFKHFNPTSSPSVTILEQWRINAHRAVDDFYEYLRYELFERKKKNPLEKLTKMRNTLDELIRKQGATRENIDEFTNDIQLVEQEIKNLQNIQVKLRPLVIDANSILESTSNNRIQESYKINEPVRQTPFQLFIQPTDGQAILLTIEPTETIRSLKEKIANRIGIPVEHQNLTHVGKFLKDENFIHTYDIQKQSIIQLTLRSNRKN